MRGSKHPISWLALAGILIACAAGAYLLIPNNEKVLDRLIKDGKYDRALQYVESLPKSVREKNPLAYTLREFELKRKLLEDRKQAAVILHLQESLRAYQAFSNHTAFLNEAVETVRLLGTPEEAEEIVQLNSAGLPVAAKYALTQALVQKALASNKPESAAASFERYWDGAFNSLPPGERIRQTSEGVRLWRSAAQPARALALIDRYEQKSGADLFATARDLGKLKVNLLRELNRPEEACNLLRALVKQKGYETAGPELIEIMLKTAAESDLQDDLVPDFREIAAARPRDTNVWERFGQLAVNAGMLDDATNAYVRLVELVPESAPYQRELAQLYEWKEQPNLAFDLDLKLARQGDLEALDNLRELNPGLYRGRELLQVMRSLGPLMEQEKYRLPMADLLIEHGEYEECERYFELHLRDHPEDIDALRKYGDVLEQEFKFQRLLPVLLKIAQLQPRDEELETRVAELYYLLGDYDRSFQEYLKLLPQTVNLDTIEACGTMAQALGDYPQYTASLERRIAVLTAAGSRATNDHGVHIKLSPSDYSDLADSYRLRGDPKKQAGLLEEGIARFPESGSLKLQLAFVLSDLKRYSETARLLEKHPGLKRDLNLIHMYLDALVEAQEPERAEAFVKTLAPEYLNSPEIAPLLSAIYDKTRNYSAAVKLYRNLSQPGNGKPASESASINLARVLSDGGDNRAALQVLLPLLQDPAPEVMKIAAKVYGELRQYKEAEALQKRYLQETKNASFQDWGYLGDIYLASGNRAEAQKAYAEAVSRFHKEASRSSP